MNATKEKNTAKGKMEKKSIITAESYFCCMSQRTLAPDAILLSLSLPYTYLEQTMKVINNRFKCEKQNNFVYKKIYL